MKLIQKVNPTCIQSIEKPLEKLKISINTTFSLNKKEEQAKSQYEENFGFQEWVFREALKQKLQDQTSTMTVSSDESEIEVLMKQIRKKKMQVVPSNEILKQMSKQQKGEEPAVMTVLSDESEIEILKQTSKQQKEKDLAVPIDESEIEILKQTSKK
ncbi:2868_t:CDS:2 [Ambispora gerdemannii]|uniref:2868_t:CDS:1 n=1 Tax=Ambispora gerdemannii TaxID=144530 RepID=A0A9N9AWY3_9GLOM|nr:2868_t:CDS:2 [Ambispora gerdemannii]